MNVNSSTYILFNGQLHHDHNSNQFRAKYLPTPDEYQADDCFSNYTKQGNYLRSIFFASIYWITLTVVLVAGATKISLFSLGYLIGCFIFLWLGNDSYLMPLSRLKASWTWFIFYATLVIFVKVILQLYACYYHDYLINHCYVLQLLRVVCYRKVTGATEPVGTCVASLAYNQLDILWDGLCLAFLMLQRVVFSSQYFLYLVQEVKAQQILASRGAELIMATQIEEAKAQDMYEKEVMRSVREKMENLKSDNQQTSKAWQRLLNLPHHHQIIRNAGKHLFSSTNDDPVSLHRSNNWKFKKAFIPDPLGDELERMADINGISAVFTRWMKGKQPYGPSGSQSNLGNTSANISGVNSSDDLANQDETADQTGANLQNSSQDTRLPSMDENDDDIMGVVPAGNLDRQQTGGSYDVIPDDETGSESGRLRGWLDTLNLIIYSCLLSASVELNKLSRSYRYVSRRMAVEKNILKKQFNLNDPRFKTDSIWRKQVISTISETYTKSNEQYQGRQSSASLERIRSALKVIASNGGQNSQDSDGRNQSTDSDRSHTSALGSPARTQNRTELTDPEYYFLRLNIFTQFCRALAYVFISNTSLLCQLVIIMNQVLSASLLSLPLPMLTFLWGTLSVPRPTKRFWKTVITYTEVVIVIKYVCQFPIWSWDINNINPFYYPNLLGIKDITLIYDLLLLLALFFHRSMLKSLGQWGSSATEDPKRALNNSSDTAEPVISPDGNGESSKYVSQDDLRLTRSYQGDIPVEPGPGLSGSNLVRTQRIVSYEDLNRAQSYDEYNDHPHKTYHYERQEIRLSEEDGAQEVADKRPCCIRAYNRVRRSIGLFFQHALNTPYKVQTDVYTWMFLCDFINFLILIYGFWAFGSGYTNQTVASFLNENRIPFSVLIMLLAQFASMIIDRAFYLQKNIGGKLTFQVILIIGIHLWLFFALPFSTGHALTLKEYWPPKAFYVFKCLYFLLSAHQIRSGYPRRVLGNCFTKGFGYANWGAFRVYRAIPLIYDLRLYMDWIWTETTLEFRNWSIMEDMFANLFIRKCELTLEEDYPYPRARPMNRTTKYLTGGAFILLILAIIWGPLLLFSMGKTVGESNPPIEMQYELEFVGYQPILRLRATAQQILQIDSSQYEDLKKTYVSQSSQSFISDYKVGDVSAIMLDGQSNAVWEISPPSMQTLMSRIKDNQTFTLKSSWTLFRVKQEKSQSFDVNIAGSYQYVIEANSSQNLRNDLYHMLVDSSTTQTPPEQIKFIITPPIFPNFIRVPETGQVSLVDQILEQTSLRSLKLSYVRMFDNSTQQTDDSTSWWKAEDLCKDDPSLDSFPFWSPDALPHCNSLLMVAFNDRIFTGILALLSAPGIIGLYTTFVVFFARLIRTEPAGKVIYTEIPKVDRVYGLIMDIYMMRECGEFELEEKLFAKLLFLYRSPEMLIEWSKREDELYYGINEPNME